MSIDFKGGRENRKHEGVELIGRTRDREEGPSGYGHESGETLRLDPDRMGEADLGHLARISGPPGWPGSPVGGPDGWTFGKFRIIRELGRGGFGVVFLAIDHELRRQVALKLPRADAAQTPEVRERFVREARAAAALDHPNLVPLYEAGEVGKVQYLASAYCEGPTLARWLKEHKDPVSPRLAARLVGDMADAVQHAHDRGVLHRDLKPSNILMQRGPSAQGSSGTPARGLHGRL